jgi:hypothetical protein
MKEICEGLPAWGHWLVLIAWLVWDFIFGETKSKSAGRLILNSIVSIKERFKERKNESGRDPSSKGPS